VLYVISRYTYRSTFIVREIDELAARGWTIEVVSLRRPLLAPGTDRAHLPYAIAYDPFLAPRVLLALMTALASRSGVLAGYLRLMVTAFGRDPKLLARNLGVIPKACFYAAVARRLGCRHIHAHWATVSTSAAMLISRLSALPFSFTGHAWDIFCDTRLLKEKSDAARFVLTCTGYNRRYLIDIAGVDGEKVHVVYHGLRIPARTVPAAATSPSFAAPAGAAETSPVPRPLAILTVGRWSEKKGFLDLIAALALVRDAGVPFELQIIAGDGSPAYARRVREAIAACRLDDRVRISDWLPSAEVEAAMRASDLFVLPCVTPANGALDGIPNVLIEALSVGLPVVATRLSGIPELIRHGETGLLVNERDPRALAATIVWCAAHRGEAARLADEGRRLVERTFDIARTIDALERHFEAAIAATAPVGDTSGVSSRAAATRGWRAPRHAQR